jgi:LacI family transcriptional regulator
MPPLSSRPVTAADIAMRLSLAPTTVAAALRGETRIAASTRERVALVAAELGYRRNLAASLLGSRRQPGRPPTLSAAYLVRLTGAGATPYDATLRAAFDAAGWGFQIINLMTVRDLTALARRLENQGVDGLVLGPTTPTDLPLPALPWERFALVSVIRQRASEGFDTVRTNHFGSVLGLFDAVITHGYRRIGVLHRSHTPALQDDDARLAAFLLLQKRRSPGAPPVFLHELPFRAERNAERADLAALDAWLTRHRPELVIGFNSGDRDLLAQTGRRIPTDLAFASLHTYANQRPALAGLQAPAEIVADLTRLRLEQKLRLGELGLSARPIESVVTPAFLPGASLPACDR